MGHAGAAFLGNAVRAPGGARLGTLHVRTTGAEPLHTFLISPPPPDASSERRPFILESSTPKQTDLMLTPDLKEPGESVASGQQWRVQGPHRGETTLGIRPGNLPVSPVRGYSLVTLKQYAKGELAKDLDHSCEAKLAALVSQVGEAVQLSRAREPRHSQSDHSWSWLLVSRPSISRSSVTSTRT